MIFEVLKKFVKNRKLLQRMEVVAIREAKWLYAIDNQVLVRAQS
jgi:hypothetical protein